MADRLEEEDHVLLRSLFLREGYVVIPGFLEPSLVDCSSCRMENILNAERRTLIAEPSLPARPLARSPARPMPQASSSRSPG